MKLVDAVETELFSREEKEIDSKVIGEIVMERLKNLDAVGLCAVCIGVPGV